MLLKGLKPRISDTTSRLAAAQVEDFDVQTRCFGKIGRTRVVSLTRMFYIVMLIGMPRCVVCRVLALHVLVHKGGRRMAPCLATTPTPNLDYPRHHPATPNACQRIHMCAVLCSMPK